uniref:Reverse transcriptase zinc-binding domain-containing protein n=1 Tax=Chenopodium quinoa TaxID=63459 RepID=A0A803KUG1_CHEQI
MDENIPVNWLMVEGCMRWDNNKIRDLFDDETAVMILTNPLPSHATRDNIYWGCTQNGMFTVKSCYWLARDVTAGVGDVGSNEDCWRSVWRIQGPPKLKHFLWGAVKGNLDVKDRIMQRHITNEASCQDERTDAVILAAGLCRLVEDYIICAHKANVDAHVPVIGNAGLGVVFRDVDGSLVLTATKMVSSSNPECVEAQAVR